MARLGVADRGSVVIVSGAPGCGKTSLARELAAADPRAVHLVSDFFYEFIAKPIDPSTPESQHQNGVILQAVARATHAFANGGYTVYVDGVIGPWFLDVFEEALAPDIPTHYIVLQASAAEAVDRVRGREGPGLSPKVLRMVPKFFELGALAHHAIDTMDQSETEVREIVTEGLAGGLFKLDWGLVSS